MKNYRIIETGVIVPHNELQATFPNVSFAPELTPDVMDVLGMEPAADTPEALPSVPLSVSMRQARLALLAAGVLAGVDTAITALPSPQKEAAQIEWNYAATVKRASPLVSMLGAALALDADALDALFVTAEAL